MSRCIRGACKVEAHPGRKMCREHLRAAADRAAKRLARETSAKRTERRAKLIPAGAPSTHLVADKRRGDDIQRRRFDCARLADCERGWCILHHAEQARCPDPCDAYVRETR
jgi:hypothetical protein